MFCSTFRTSQGMGLGWGCPWLLWQFGCIQVSIPWTRVPYSDIFADQLAMIMVDKETNLYNKLCPRKRQTKLIHPILLLAFSLASCPKPLTYDVITKQMLAVQRKGCSNQAQEQFTKRFSNDKHMHFHAFVKQKHPDDLMLILLGSQFEGPYTRCEKYGRQQRVSQLESCGRFSKPFDQYGDPPNHGGFVYFLPSRGLWEVPLNQYTSRSWSWSS